MKLSILVLLLGVRSFAVGLELTASPSSVAAGEATTISWHLGGADRAYLSILGMVPSDGSRQFAPLRSSEVHLVTTIDGVAEVRTVAIVVTGAKGSSDFPSDLERFHFPATDTRRDIALEEFLSHVHRVLQDDLHFSVNEITSKDQPYSFITNLSERNGLVQASEKNIRARRIAYMVRVRPQGNSGKTIWYEVSTMLEYQRRVESTWRPDTDETRIQVQAAALRKMLASAH